MSQSAPDRFSFVLSSGMFADPIFMPVITAHGLSTLAQMSTSPKTPLSARSLLLQALPHLTALTQQRGERNIQEGDIRSPKFEHLKSTKGHAPKRVLTSLVSTTWAILVLPGAPRSQFDAQNPNAASRQMETWGWPQAQALAPLLKTLKKICHSAQITFNATALLRAAKCQSELGANALSIRDLNAQEDLARAVAYVIYDPATEGYMSHKWDTVSLASARLFESESAARRAAARPESPLAPEACVEENPDVFDPF